MDHAKKMRIHKTGTWRYNICTYFLYSCTGK